MGAIWVIGIPALAPNNTTVSLLTSSIGLLVILLYFPEGVESRSALRPRRHHGVEPSPLRRKTPVRAGVLSARLAQERRPHRPRGSRRSRCRRLSVAFGGNAAVDDVSLTVNSGEIVELMGPTGRASRRSSRTRSAGSCRARGSFGSSTTKCPARRYTLRAELARARADIPIGHPVSELTVADTLLVALEAKGRTAMVPTALGLPSARRRNRAASAEVGELIHFLGLGPCRDHYIDDL